MSRARRPCIGLVTPAFDRGGLEQVVLNLYKGYRRAGFDCLVLVETREVGEAAAQIAPDDVVVFAGEEARFLSALTERRPGALHYHHSTFGLRQAAALGLWTVYTLHSVYSWMDDAAFAARCAQIASAARVAAVSAFARDYFLQRSGSRSPIHVVANGVDAEALAAGARRVSRAELGVPEDGFLFVVPAGLFPAKHQFAAVGAMEAIGEAGEAHLLLLGRDLDPDYAAALRARRAVSPVGARITIRGPLPRPQMASLYRDVADAVLLPSLQEGSSNVVREALLYDTPLVLTDVGDAREAAALSDRVTLAPRAYGGLLELTPSELGRLSRDTAPPNLQGLAAAMRAAMQAAAPPASASELAARREALSSRVMTDAYLNLMADAPLLFQRARSA